MTSGPTRADTEAFFKNSGFFGLDASNVKFFDQGVLPAFFSDGKIIMEDKDKVSVAPDGNGGVYAALRTTGVLDDMEKRGKEYVYLA
jgi:UDP-N-acetylglucosamine/UDP-N-acetylgalactosamine diphosphorylase